MRFGERNIRVRSLIEIGVGLFACLVTPPAFCSAMQNTADAPQQGKASTGHGPLTTEQVVEKLVGMNLRRAQALHSYHGTRTYRVEYRSSLTTVSAEMVVEAIYRAPATKELTVRSLTGSRLLIDKVFTKILKAERDAVSTDAQRRTAISGDNYDFKMVGYEGTPTQSIYVLAVVPRTTNKLLFRGRVWVDGDDFAVVRIEAEPAKNPSFWTKNSQIEQSYVKVNDFWLPERNHSISSIRLGGRAELTIEYQDYQILAADPVGSVPAHEITRFVDTSHTIDDRQPSLRHVADVGCSVSPARTVIERHQSPDQSPLPQERQAPDPEEVGWQ